MDDDPSSRRLMRSWLTHCGYEQVRMATSGIEALSEVCRKHPDCILVDLLMPGMDGFMVSTIIRDYEMSRPARAYIVAMPTLEGQGIRELCAEAGMDDYLTKPFGRAELESVLWAARATQIEREHCLIDNL